MQGPHHTTGVSQVQIHASLLVASLADSPHARLERPVDTAGGVVERQQAVRVGGRESRVQHGDGVEGPIVVPPVLVPVGQCSLAKHDAVSDAEGIQSSGTTHDTGQSNMVRGVEKTKLTASSSHPWTNIMITLRNLIPWQSLSLRHIYTTSNAIYIKKKKTKNTAPALAHPCQLPLLTLHSPVPLVRHCHGLRSLPQAHLEAAQSEEGVDGQGCREDSSGNTSGLHRRIAAGEDRRGTTRSIRRCEGFAQWIILAAGESQTVPTGHTKMPW